MDVLRWIKREWDTTQSCNRRESEPAISANSFRTTKSRDESYMRALAKFNEWRYKERFGSFRRSSRRRSKKSKNNTCDTIVITGNESTMKTNPNTPDSINDDTNLYEEIKTPKDQQKTKNIFDSAKKILYKRHSCPTNNNNSRAKKVKVPKSLQKCQVISENDVEEFENNHCERDSVVNNDIEKVSMQSSPPSKFYRDNSNPFKETRTPVRAQYATSLNYGTPRRLFETTTAALDSIRSSLPKDSDNSQISTKSKRYDFNPLSIYEGETDKTNQNFKLPTYQTVINKHGDLVEYALPFNDQSDEIFGVLKHCDSKLKTTSILNTTTVPFIEEDETPVNRRKSKSLCGFASYGELKQPQTPVRRIIVTDLDKSDATTRNETVQKEEIIQELSLLEKWSKTRSNHLEKTPSKCSEYLSDRWKDNNNLIFCTICDIRQRTSTLRSTTKTPIAFSAGNFRKTAVSLRKIVKTLRIESEQGILRDLFVLSKIKHPNVTLLMAVCLDADKNILSLLLEPFDSTINVLIYDSDNKLTIKDCIDYTMQIIRAVMYLHENGLIHSNICSHNILVCDNKKNVKLSSFELATETDEKKIQNEIIHTFYGGVTNYNESRLKAAFADVSLHSLISKKEMSSKYLPYFLEYRRLYSDHRYQAPELLSVSRHFVVPSKYADVYSVSLLLWEMLNMCVPFEVFSYEETEKIFRQNEKNHLPLFEDERCELFKSLLEYGLKAYPSDRIESAQSLKFLIEEAKAILFAKKNATQDNSKYNDSNSCFLHNDGKSFDSFNENNEPSFDLENSPNNIGLQPHIFDKTSTVKRFKKPILTGRKKIESSCDIQQYLKRQTPTNKYSSRSLDDILRTDVSNDKKNDYEFHIGDFSLPVTPIARNNKLRRNAWLSNKTLSHNSYRNFDEHEEEPLYTPNNNNGPNMDKTKQYNVSIKIIQKINNDLTTSPSSQEKSIGNAANVSAQIEYWNTVIPPVEVNLKKQNNIEHSPNNINNDQEKVADNPNDNLPTEEIITPDAIPKPKERKSIKKLMAERAKYYPNMPELLSETFLRRSFNDDNDFESTLWKRERERCEQINPRLVEETSNFNTDGIIRPLRTSVKDTVHKFESFTKKSKTCLSPFKDIRTQLQNNSINDLIVSDNAQENFKDQAKDTFINLDAPIVVITADSNDEQEPENVADTSADLNISISKLDVKLKSNNLSGSSPKLSPKICASTSKENQQNKVSHLSIPSLNSSVQLRKSRPILFTVNVRKINRRASDIGCVRKNTVKPEQLLRHSIPGTDILKTMSKISIMNSEANNPIAAMPKNSTKSITSLAESEIQNCKLTCWKCGSKVFKVDELGVNERGIRTRGQFLRRFSNSPGPSRSSATTSQRMYPSTSSFETTEDFYIDDDFGLDNEKLGANVQLISTDEFDLFDILSIDILSTPPLFNPFE